MQLDGTIDAREALSIYLQDHHAGAQGGTRLAQRAEDNQPDRAEELGRVVRQIEQDEDALDRLMAELSVDSDTLKDVGATVGEWLGRFKLNGQLTGSSPLSPVVELEALMSGVFHKRHLWLALRDAAGLEPTSVDLDELVARAEEQLEVLRPLWLDAARDAFA